MDPSAGRWLKAMSMRSAGSAPAARSGHSISASVPSGSGDRPISSSSAGIVDAVEVGVDQTEGRKIVALRQREGRARHLQRIVAGEIADHRARRRGLAGAEIARQRDDVAGSDQQREIGHQMRGRGLVRQRDRECRRCRSFGGVAVGGLVDRKVARDRSCPCRDRNRRAPCRRAVRQRSAPATGRGRRRDAASRWNGFRTSRTPCP